MITVYLLAAVTHKLMLPRHDIASNEHPGAFDVSMRCVSKKVLDDVFGSSPILHPISDYHSRPAYISSDKSFIDPFLRNNNYSK